MPRRLLFANGMKKLLAVFCMSPLAALAASGDKWPKGNNPADHSKLAVIVKGAVKRLL